jgi:HAD superfamily hydrolase (TIGR01490 family)
VSSAAAFFDVDGTLTRTTIVEPLIWYQRARLSALHFGQWCAGLVLRAPYFLWVDRRSRGQFNIVFYRLYAGFRADDLRDWHRRTFAENLQRTIFPAALDCVDSHRGQGRRLVLVTGSLDFVMRPLADFLGADELVANRLVERDGTFTGELDGPPVADENKASVAREYAQRQGVDLSASFAYGNSIADAPMLGCAGHPFAVNPDSRLRRLAAGRGWPTMHWKPA